MQSVEQDARDLLERAGVEDAQSMTSGDLVEIANLLSELYKLRAAQSEQRNEWQCPKCNAMNYGDCWKCGEHMPARR